MATKLPALSFLYLSELLLQKKSETIFTQLDSMGCKISLNDENWVPLSEGRAYYHSKAKVILTDGIRSKLVVQLSREAENKEPQVDGFEFQADSQEDSQWAGEIRKILSQYFIISQDNGSGVEIFERGTLEQSILISGSTTKSVKLLMHRRNLIRN